MSTDTLRDDRIQGILFSRSEFLNLAGTSHRNQFMETLRRSRRYLRNKNSATADILVRKNPVTISLHNRAQKRQNEQLDYLEERLHLRSSRDD